MGTNSASVLYLLGVTDYTSGGSAEAGKAEGRPPSQPCPRPTAHLPSSLITCLFSPAITSKPCLSSPTSVPPALVSKLLHRLFLPT